MLYKDYRNSSRKHLYTCKVLFEKLNNLDESRHKAEYKCLLLNLYYISGYIIECIVKYGIYDLVGHPRGRDVSELDKNGLTYQEHIKHHKFSKYSDYLNQRIGVELPLISSKKGIDKKVIELYNEWGADVRYSYDLKGKASRHYFSFYKYAEQINKTIIRNVKG